MTEWVSAKSKKRQRQSQLRILVDQYLEHGLKLDCRDCGQPQTVPESSYRSIANAQIQNRLSEFLCEICGPFQSKYGDRVCYVVCDCDQVYIPKPNHPDLRSIREQLLKKSYRVGRCNTCAPGFSRNVPWSSLNDFMTQKLRGR